MRVELAVLLVDDDLDPLASAGCRSSRRPSCLLRAADVELVELERRRPARRRPCRPCRWPSGLPVFGSFSSFLPRTSSESRRSSPELIGDLLVALRSRSSFCSLSNSFCSSSVMLIRRLNRCVSMTMPSTPDGTSSESFFTSSPARPKIACSSFSSGVSSVLRLRRNLADEDVARLDERADADDAVLVEVATAPSGRRSGCRG